MKVFTSRLLIASFLTTGLMAPEGFGQTFTFSTLAGGARGTNDGVGTGASFSAPSGVAVDTAGNAYVADQVNNSIRKLTPQGTNWLVTTIAGGTRGSADGTNAEAEFSGPTGIAVDSASNLYVADQFNYTIRKITPEGTNWVVTTIAGHAGVSGLHNATGTAAEFFNPTGVAIDASNNIFVADEFNNAIRLLTPVGTNWAVTTIAGGTSGSSNGVGTNAQFFSPSGIAIDTNDRVFVADQFNNSIRLLTQSGSNWTVSTIAGQTTAGSSNGLGTNALFDVPVGVAVDPSGNVFVADQFNDAIRELAPSGSNWQVSTIGGGRQGSADGTGTNAEFYLPNNVGTDGYDEVFVTDSGNNAIRLGLSSAAPAAVGNLTVNITPTNVVTAGAQWQLNGGAFEDSGAILTNLAAGQYMVTFSNISGFTTPAPQPVPVTAHETTVITGNYPTAIPNAGSLEVLLYPFTAVDAGAEWQVDDGPLETNGAIVAGLSIGTHTLAFNSIPGWITPSNQVVTVTNSETTLGIGDYVLVAPSSFTLAVNASPADEGSADANGAVFTVGTSATLTATPSNGFEFIGWAGEVATGTNNPLTLPVNTNLIVTAYFAPVGSTTLTVVTNGNGTVTPNWNGKKLRAGQHYPLTATPRSGNLFSNWTGTITTNRNPLSVKLETSMVLQANFIPNPFTPILGIYNGLFYTTNVTEGTAGMLSRLVLGQKGGYSGAVLINGSRYGISGIFDLSGHASNRIARPASQGGPLEANLTLDFDYSPPELSGTVAGTSWTATLVADRATNSLPSAQYVMLIPPDTNNAPPVSSPGGDGYAAITNYPGPPHNPAAATTRINGSLADGTAFSETVPVSQDGYVPLYANLYGGKGLLLGWINLAVTNSSQVGLTWIHPQRQTGLYQAGFTNILLTNQILLSPWTNETAVTDSLTNLWLLDTATDTNALTNILVNVTGTRITSPTMGNVMGTINLHTGIFKLTIGRGVNTMTLSGGVLPIATNGAGYFLTKTDGQAVELRQ